MPRFVVALTAALMLVQVGARGAAGQVRRKADGPEPPLRIEGAKVSTDDQAEKIAIEAYFRRMGGKRGLQTAKVVSIHTLDVEIQGFARRGDRVWEVRIVGVKGLIAIIWVHADTGATKFLVSSSAVVR